MERTSRHSRFVLLLLIAGAIAAVALNRDKLDFALLDTDAIITVCRTDRRSASAANQLRDLGVENLSVLRGGMVRWGQLGYDIAGTPGPTVHEQESHS